MLFTDSDRLQSPFERPFDLGGQPVRVSLDAANLVERLEYIVMIKNNGHHPYILMGYLPRERILMYGDMYNPPAGSDPRDLARTNEFATNLYENIQRLKLDVQLLAPIHGQPVPFDNLKKAIGLLPLMP